MVSPWLGRVGVVAGILGIAAVNASGGIVFIIVIVDCQVLHMVQFGQ